jgi:SAM-dependent methyltransferase
MTEEILRWLQTVALPLARPVGHLLEVGARDINGSARLVFESQADTYIGTDMEAGIGVDVVVHNRDLGINFGEQVFDTIICCECLEHDIDFKDTLTQLHELLKTGGNLIITTPALGFPYHPYPRHYVNFSRDAYEDIFFNDMEILDLRSLNSAAGSATTLVGIARKHG